MGASSVGNNKHFARVYFFDGNQGVAVGDEGLILRTADGGAMWQSVGQRRGGRA